jgi:ABC-type transport system substrate-binding protein
VALVPAAQAQKVLRVGSTLADVPLTTGQPDQGGEGQRFMGYTLYDALINWDLSQGDKASGLVPGLATSWKPDDADRRNWVFEIRKGVKFHDGSEFTAEVAAWNLGKIMDPKSPQYEPKQAAQGRLRISDVVGWKVLDKYRLMVTTKTPNSFFPYQICWITMSSMAHWEKLGKSWDRYALTPSGTGPWKLDRWSPRERAELVRNPEYWDKARVPKIDRMVLVLLPDANARVAALRSGQVDWIEAPPPDAIPSLKQAGFNLVTNGYPHNWTYTLSYLPNSPWQDVRVRKAANLAIDRDGLVKFLGGMALPAKGYVLPSSPWFGKPSFQLKHDPNEARKLMAEAGFSKQKPLAVKLLISASGSGQMQPLPMNEFVQQNLEEVGFKVEFIVVEWNTLLNIWRAGAQHEMSRGGHALNVTWFLQDPHNAFVRHMDSALVPPGGVNWANYKNADVDALIHRARITFDPAEQNRALQALHEKVVNDAWAIMVVHDLNPRAMHKKVKGFVQAQNWFQDFSRLTVD